MRLLAAAGVTSCLDSSPPLPAPQHLLQQPLAGLPQPDPQLGRCCCCLSQLPLQLLLGAPGTVICQQLSSSTPPQQLQEPVVLQLLQ